MSSGSSCSHSHGPAIAVPTTVVLLILLAYSENLLKMALK